jgi:hypothetical protein
MARSRRRNGKVRVLGAVVEMAACLLAALVPDRPHRRAIGRASIRHDDLADCRSASLLSLRNSQCGSLVPSLRDEGLQNLTFVIDRSPQVVSLPTDLYEHLVQVPLPLRRLPHSLRPALADLGCEVSPEAVHPMPDGFVANVEFLAREAGLPHSAMTAEIARTS